jgi:hypothetical protein
VSSKSFFIFPVLCFCSRFIHSSTWHWYMMSMCSPHSFALSHSYC